MFKFHFFSWVFNFKISWLLHVLEVLNFIILSKNRFKILPGGRLSSGLDSSVNTIGLVSKFNWKNLEMHSFQHQFLCTSWKGHFISQAEYEMINSAWNQYLNYTVLPAMKRVKTCYRHLFLWQTDFGNNHWFKVARDQIFSSKTN